MNTSLLQRHPQYGSWLQTGSSVIAELADASGFDWLLIDLEHGCGTDAMVIPQLQAIRRAAPIVRVGAPHPELISRALDWGAAGIMVPMVSTAEKAEACVRAMHFPPRGDRGLAGMVRAFNYGLETEALLPSFFAQIETIDGVENARAIAAVDGVDVLFVGPMDLKLHCKSYPERATRDYAACLQEVADAARSAGKLCGMLMRQSDDVAAMHEMGYTHLAIETDITVLREGYRRILEPLRDKGTRRPGMNGVNGVNGSSHGSRQTLLEALPLGRTLNAPAGRIEE
jgi:2-dehydro-3-deoxyglucarate aldolase/4-hydroxy-2-oxoheptanedioate aldolase